MRLKAAIIIPLFLLSFWGCAQDAYGPGVVKSYPGRPLLLQAEKFYQTAEYKKALAAYVDYIARFPQSPMAPAALMKIASIYTIQEKYADARNVYKRIMAEYPSSPFALDAMVSILITYYQQGDYESVLRQAPVTLKKTNSKVHIIKTYAILGDAALAIDAVKDAVFFYSKAHQIATDKEQEEIGAKLKAAIARLNQDDIRSIMGHAQEKPSLTYLLYQIALAKDESGHHNDALWVLTYFMEQFPDHEKVSEAELLIKKYQDMAIYHRYSIGCLLPLSGSYAIYGQRALKGVEFALSQHDASATNPMVKVIVKDTGSDPDSAAQAVAAFAEEQVAAIMGPISTAESAATVAQGKGIPLITITQKEDIVDKGDYIFRNFFTPRMQIRTLVTYAMEKLGLNNFAVLYPNDDYGETFMNLFWDEVVQQNGKIVAIEAFDTDATDFGDTIKKITGLYYNIPKGLPGMKTPVRKVRRYKRSRTGSGRNRGPGPIVEFEAIFIPDEPKRTAMLIPQLAFHDITDVYLLGTNLWHSDKLIRMASRYAQSAIMPDVFFAESEAPHVKQFVSGFEKIYGEKPGFIEAIAYDTAMIMLQMVSRQDIMFRSSFKDELLHFRNYPGVTGLTSFTTNGDVQKKLYLLRIKGDQFEEVDRENTSPR